MTAEHSYGLWGTPHSLYTGKIRSYLIKKGLPFRDLRPSNPDFATRIVPRISNFVVPVLETPDGRVLQDTTDMIEYLEEAHPSPRMIPETPVQRAVAWLIGAFGSEQLLPAAMHYRWSYRAEQEAFLRAEFGRAVYSGPDPAQRSQAGLRLMDYFNSFLPPLGVVADTIPTVETAYGDLLDALETHFQRWPYVLGGFPSIADFGLMAPLYAHLARDPVPATHMKGRAPNVYRWTERMNLPQIVDGEFRDIPASYPADDAIPDTLEPILKLVFGDWGPQLIAEAEQYNRWIAANPSMPAGQLVSASGERKVHPTLGPIEFAWRGCRVRRASEMHALWHFDKAATHARALEGPARKRYDELTRRCGGETVMAIRLARPMKRADYALVVA